jgi:hypothetical protein
VIDQEHHNRADDRHEHAVQIEACDADAVLQPRYNLGNYHADDDNDKG